MSEFANMPPTVSREIHLKSRPSLLPSRGDFEIVEVPVPQPENGQVLVRNLFLSVDPYMRGQMVEQARANSFALGKPMDGACVGTVIESKRPDLKAGDYVLGEKSWRELYLSDGSELKKFEPGDLPVQTWLGVMGISGFTAYLGMLEVGKPHSRETVFVSAAAGAVGNTACQLAKLKSCRVIGSAGSDEKVEWLRQHGGIEAFNYKTVDSIEGALKQLSPGGIDIYFDNVGGPHLEAALESLKTFGRVLLCGMISKTEADGRPFPLTNLNLAVRKRLTLTGFRASDHLHLFEQFSSDMRRWIEEGKIAWTETIVDGLDNAPDAFLGLFRGENLGKMLVRVE
jgi:NADPH-dependent curcumin reductase CurA